MSNSVTNPAVMRFPIVQLMMASLQPAYPLTTKSDNHRRRERFILSLCLLNQVHDARHVEDQADVAVAQDRPTARARDAAQRLAEALDHDLFLPEQLVDEQAATAVVVLHDDDERLA